MKWIKVYYTILISLSFFSNVGWTSDAQKLSFNQMTHLTLKNGLRICLKKSDLEPQQFDFELFAVGGFSSLPVVDQPSAWLATEIAWESGLNHLTGDKLACDVDDHSVEIRMALQLFDRKIEASGPILELPYCLKLVRLLFTAAQFNQAGMKEALAHARRHLEHQFEISQLTGEQTSLKVNLREWSVTAPFHPSDLGKVELTKAEKIFKHFFSNPAEFTLALVGDFNPEEIIPVLEQSLGSLPSFPINQYHQPRPPPFPEGITKKEFAGVNRYRQNHTRLTFPLCAKTTNPIALDLLCLILKQELTSGTNLGILQSTYLNISYSFPLFPCVDPLWLVIKFSSPVHETSSICQEILRKMVTIKQEGVLQKRIKSGLEELVKKRESLCNNAAVLALIADYYRAGWEMNQLSPSLNDNQEKELLKALLGCYPDLTQYSIISLHP